jgi:hypothetical protein
MNSWLITLYLCLIAVVVLDAGATALAAFWLFRLRQRFGHYIAWAFVGVAIEAGTAVLTTGLQPAPVRIVPWVVGLRIAARLIKAFLMFRLTLFLLGYINGDYVKHK